MRTIRTKDGELIEVGAKGGAGSSIPWWELLDFRAVELAAVRMTKGARKYAIDNWRACPWREHLRHAIRHAYATLEPDQQRWSDPWAVREHQREELAGFVCRALMAAGVYLQDPGVEDKVPTGLAIEAKPLRPRNTRKARKGVK